MSKLPRPPKRGDFSSPMSSLKQRITYAKTQLGVRLEVIATRAGLSEKALRTCLKDDWNPQWETLMAVDRAVTDTIAQGASH